MVDIGEKKKQIEFLPAESPAVEPVPEVVPAEPEKVSQRA